MVRTMQPSESPRDTVRDSATVSCLHTFAEGVLLIQMASSKTGLVGGWEYKLSGSTPHNGITKHNTNKAKVQANTLLPQTHTGRMPCLSEFLLISFFNHVPFPSILFFIWEHNTTVTDTMFPYWQKAIVHWFTKHFTVYC